MQINRRTLLAAAMATPVSAACTTLQPSAPSRTLIRGADLVTMEAEGELLRTDILIDRGKIIEIDRGLPADGASVVEASGMILMPGMIDGHRHVWQTILNGLLPKMSPAYSGYDRLANMTYALCFDPDDMQHAQYIGGLACLDAGVTTVIDQMHAANGDEMELAAARGLKASGVAGVFCYQMRNGPYYGRGDTYPHARAVAERNQPPDERHWRNAERIRDTYFSSEDLLGFGIGLTGSVGAQTVDVAIREFHRARTLQPRMLTQHMNQRAGTEAPILRGVSDLAAAGVLGPDYLVSHGVDMTDAEMGMLRDAGAGLSSTVLGEFNYPKPSVHGRARAIGLNVAIGLDVGIALTHDYFEHLRAAYWSLMRTDSGRRAALDLSPVDTLHFATGNALKAAGYGDVTGSLKRGKRADLVLLRTDRSGFPKLGSPAGRVLTGANQADIDSVWVNGRLVKSGGRLTGVDQANLETTSARIRESVLAYASTITLT
jgi:cytosine/adenosine deaminase-related metal-dependent hydrolase